MRKILSILTFTAVAVLCAGSAVAQNLEFKILADKTDFALGEPVIFFMTLKNAGPAAADVMLPLDPMAGYVVFTIKDPQGRESAFTPWAHGDPAAPYHKLQPGQVITEDAKIFFGSSGWTFSSPGTYLVRAAYLGSAQSNAASITIRQPATNDERQAADLFLQSKEVGYFLIFEGGDHLRDGVNRLEQAANRFPNSPLASYANLALGKSFLEDFANFKERRLRKADPQRAIRYLQKAALKRFSLYQVSQSHLYLSQGYAKTGNRQMAAKIRGDLSIVLKQKYSAYRLPLLEHLKKKGIVLH